MGFAQNSIFEKPFSTFHFKDYEFITISCYGPIPGEEKKMCSCTAKVVQWRNLYYTNTIVVSLKFFSSMYGSSSAIPNLDSLH